MEWEVGELAGRDIMVVGILCVVVAAAYVDELHDGPSSLLGVIVVGFLVFGIRILRGPLRFMTRASAARSM